MPTDVVSIVSGSILVAVGANIAIPLPFTPVPVSLQTLAVMITAVALGGRRGALAMLLYIAEGMAGLPVFAGGRAGASVILGPTGGYVLGFVAAALVAGSLAEKGWNRRLFGAAALFVLGDAALFAPGLLWLSAFTGSSSAAALGLVPFLPGEAIKLAAFCIPLQVKGPRQQK